MKTVSIWEMAAHFTCFILGVFQLRHSSVASKYAIVFLMLIYLGSRYLLDKQAIVNSSAVLSR